MQPILCSTKILFVACLVFASVGARGRNVSFESGVDVKRMLDTWSRMAVSGVSDEETMDVSFLQGYVAGTMDSMYGQFCPPTALSVDQSLGIVRKYLDEHPEQWHRNRAWLIHQALLTTFPCSHEGK
jgi:Rap1a immunity proteins